ncbi:uncharacterized protein LOC129573179 [Sitodiplosis mosellana]|uniref:uncharacterized protein LOC129573179 n=1 Tax=Sitodiplosis mosellana TaxID=263140 RepID=UPI002443C660|nr:uncharacterized protein LOC129573179 [Sitodiplosis mosellana]
MANILSIGDLPMQDNTIIHNQYHTYSPYTSSFDNNDEIRIAIQSQNLYVLPSESYLFLEVEVARKTGAEHADVVGRWTANYAAYLFSEIRYELNGTEIDRTKNVGLASNMKRFSATPSPRNCSLIGVHNGAVLNVATYSLVLPINQLLGFCDDYKKMILNAKHELVLVRNRKDIYSYMAGSESFNIKMKKIQWKVPHITLSDEAKLAMLRYLEKKQTISIPYRSWDLYEMPQLPQSRRHIWTVKSTTQISKPRYVFVVFQTNKQTVSANSATYDNCDISDVKLYLNSEYYPYDNYNLDFTSGNYQELYHSFLQIQSSYYQGHGTLDSNSCILTFDQFGNSPIFAFDCSRSEESLIGGTVDVRLEINARENIPANTAAYCLIVHDNQVEYSPFSGIVVRNT